MPDFDMLVVLEARGEEVADMEKVEEPESEGLPLDVAL